MFYRLNQLYNAVFASVSLEEYTWLQSILTPKEMALFTRQTLTEQRHALDVAIDLRRNKTAISEKYGREAYRDLLLASLLHDCGKSLRPLKLWQRVFIVSTGFFPVSWQKKLSLRKGILGNTLMIYRWHPSWGKHLAAKAGTNHQVQELILNHHNPQTPLDEFLYQADNKH